MGSPGPPLGADGSIATAEVVRVEGRTIHFKVRAEDERELIGEGIHERVVVNVERFDERVNRKARGT